MKYDSTEARRRLRECRVHFGYSQEKVAARLFGQTGNMCVSRMESGGPGSDNISKWNQFSDFFNVDLEWLLFGNTDFIPSWYTGGQLMGKKKYMRYVAKLPEEYPSTLSEIMRNDELLDKYGNQVSDEVWEEFDYFGRRIFDNLENKRMPVIFSESDFDLKKDPFPGLDIRSPFYPSHIRTALNVLGYDEKWLEEIKAIFPYRKNESLGDKLNMHGYAGVNVHEFPANFGYMVLVEFPFYSPEIDCCYIPFDVRSAGVFAHEIHIMAFDEENELIGRIDGIGMDCFGLWYANESDLFVKFDSLSQEAAEEFCIMRRYTAPNNMSINDLFGEYNKTEELNGPENYLNYINDDIALEEYCFFGDDAWVLPELRRKGVFSQMFRIIRYMYGDCSSVWSILSSLGEEFEAEALCGTIKIAEHYGLKIFDPKEDPGYQEYLVHGNDDPTPAFAYYISPYIDEMWEK